MWATHFHLVCRNSPLGGAEIKFAPFSIACFAGPKTNAYRALVDPRGWTCGFISRADVADFLVKQIDDNAFLHKTPVLTS